MSKPASVKSYQLAAKVRRARARREELGPPPRGRPGLPPSERCSSANVTWLDLVDVPRDLVREHKRELLRRRVPGALTPTDVMRLQLLALFSGLKPGAGAAMQVPVRGEQKLLGAGESTVQASNARLTELGLIERFEVRREVEWVDAFGRRHVEATVWSKTYITARGLERVRSLGESRRRVVSTGPQRSRVLTVVGLAAWLLRACGPLLRLLARRFAGAREIETPPLWGTTETREPVEGSPLRGPVFLRPATGPPSRPGGTSPPRAGARGSMGWVPVELERLWSWRALTASQAWPALYWGGDRALRRWLDRAFGASYRAELTRRFVLLSTPEERAVQQVRLEADAYQLAQLERAEPTEGEKRRRYHLYAERWQPRGAGQPGGAWVKAPVLTLNEMAKVRRAQREPAPCRKRAHG